VSLGQKLEKVRQGYIFTDILTLAISKADSVKWNSMANILNPDNKWVFIVKCNNGFYWTGGYRHGARISTYSFKTGFREEDNGYNLEIRAISENKLLTNMDENYVLNKVI
jgi:hypothetical protein